MRVALLHNTVQPGAAADEADVLVQAEAVAAALAELGHEVVAVPCDLDLASLKDRLRDERPDAVFNLVESLGGQGRLIAVVPYLLESLGIPLGGCPADAIHLTSHKPLAKSMILQAGLPTPDWFEASGPEAGARKGGDRWIVKSVWEDASVGMDDAAVTAGGIGPAAAVLASRLDTPGAPWFAEAFIEGREFNLALLDGPDGPVVLPPAEILFQDFPAGKPRIVGYAAKWDLDSFEYRNTVRDFPRENLDGSLLKELKRQALSCWHLFGLRGWARVDFRVDPEGHPFILEVNANPCLAPDAGFAAALDQAEIPFSSAVARILAARG
jgi:D-alanine-D-alanine ligase